MWKCECGEFNNDDLEYCVKCERPRLSASGREADQTKQLTTRSIFRRIQDFILFDIAFCAMVALYCVFVGRIAELVSPEGAEAIKESQALTTTLPIIAVVLFQILLVINILRMLYNSALNSERNSILLHRMYRMLKEDENKKRGDRE